MGLWKDRGKWRFRFMYQGRYHTGRGFLTKAEARKALEKKREEVKNMQILPGMDFKTAANLYLDDAKKRFVSKTYKYKVYVFKCFLEFHGNKNLSAITPLDIRNYLITRHSSNNFNVHRKELSAFFNFSISVLGAVSDNPVSKISKRPHQSRVKTIPTDKEISLLLAELSQENLFFVFILVSLGARVSEILNLKWSDVDFEKRTVTRYTRKRQGGNLEPITVYMNDDLLDVFKKLSDITIDNNYIFYNPCSGLPYKNKRKMLYSACDRADIRRIRFHELRHYFASVLAQNPSVSVKTIGDLLGHKNLATTEIYLHSIASSEKAALESLSGRFLSSGIKK